MKKLFALLLALVTLVSAIPFAGAEFKDKGMIGEDYAAAVNEMSAKGIINGFSDGSFGPKKTLTRAQAAKIICVMLEGAEKSEALTKTETGFADVPATHWAAKFVAYCVDKGIVSGVGDGKFDPDAQLTGAAFAKMLLVAYGADASAFTGAEWLKNVQTEAEKTFLLYRLKNGAKNSSIERQKAAQMAYNAQFYAEAQAAKTTKDLSGKLPTSVPESIKILAIGNSFSNDCTLAYLAPMLKDVGVKNLTLGNLYWGGGTLQMHVSAAHSKEKAYQYYKWTEETGKWKNGGKKSAYMDDPLGEEQWDIITFQQGSGYSGLPESYRPYLDLLTGYVQRTQPKAVFGWNMTWAYDTVNKNTAFANYDKDQMKMYNAILNTVHEVVETDPRFKFILPVGTAIQNARTSFIGDHMTRDGYHMNKGIGRYIASMVWACKLTGVDPEKINYLPKEIVQDKKQYSVEGLDMSNPKLLEAFGKVARESVKNALAKPFEVTQSQYKTAP